MNIEQLLAETPEERAKRNKRMDSRLLTRRKTKPKNVISVVITPRLTLGEQMDKDRARRIKDWELRRQKNGYIVKGR